MPGANDKSAAPAAAKAADKPPEPPAGAAATAGASPATPPASPPTGDPPGIGPAPPPLDPDRPTQANPQTASLSAEDKTKPTDTDAEHSVGGPNPNQTAPQQGSNAGQNNDGTDAQGVHSREADHFATHGEAPAAATVGLTHALVPGKPPAESAGYTPRPAPNTGDADTDKVAYTQAAQRLVHPEDAHPVAAALGYVGNIPPGSRPMMVDWHGVGVKPPQDVPAPEPAPTDPA